jgi:uncharacterized protein (DUF302 family)
MAAVMVLVGFGAGLLLMWIIFKISANKGMLLEYESKHSFEETVERIKKVVSEKDGWVLPFSEWYFSEAMKKHGKKFDSVDRLEVYYICAPELARQMINEKRDMSAFMPCGWGVYEKDGKVYISTVNVSWMSYLFNGKVSQLMKKVASDEHEMLEKIL